MSEEAANDTLPPPAMRETNSAEQQAMSTWSRLHSAVKNLPGPAYVVLTSTPFGILGTLWVSSPATLASLPILALPTLVMMWIYFRSSTTAEIEKHFEALIWTFYASGIISMPLVGTVQSALSYRAAYLLFGSGREDYLDEFGRSSVSAFSDSHMEARANLAWTWQNFAFLFLVAFAIDGLAEEVMKYLTVTFVQYRKEKKRIEQEAKLTEHEGNSTDQLDQEGKLTERHYIAYVIACSLGFSTLENIGFVVLSEQSDSTEIFALTVMERTLLGVGGHAMMGVMTAIRMIRRDIRGEKLRIWEVLGPAVLYHGTFDFGVFVVSAMDGNVGWIHPTKPVSLALLAVVAIGIWATLAVHLRSDLQQIRLRS